MVNSIEEKMQQEFVSVWSLGTSDQRKQLVLTERYSLV